MEQSLFIQFVKSWFGPLVLSAVETLNGTKNELTYLYKSMLRPEFSVTGRWESISAMNSLVAADIVSMDSPLPLKTRDAISKAQGEIPKIGMKLQLNERQLTDLDVLKLQKQNETILLGKLFADIPRCIGGVYERLEGAFLQALSTGVCAIQDADTVGTAIRVDYGIPTSNKRGVAVVWSNSAGATPLDDIQDMRTRVKLAGNVIAKVLLDNTALDNLLATKQIQGAYANSTGNYGDNIFAIDIDQLNSFLKKRFKFTVEVVDRVIRLEKDGVRTNFIPWADGTVAFLPGEVVGVLSWARLAEANHPVAGVEYQTADQFILVSKYRSNVPSLTEVTSSQARVLPVLTNTDQIYLMDTKTVQA